MSNKLGIATGGLAAAVLAVLVVVFIMREIIYDLLEKINLNTYNEPTMKEEIHPKYFDKVEITCACGNRLVVGSTVESMQVEVCSACHPYYTGKHKLVDVAGRVDQFKQRMKRAQESVKKKKDKGEKLRPKKRKKKEDIKLG